MKNRPKNDYAIFFRLPTAPVEEMDGVAFHRQITRTQLIPIAIKGALTHYGRMGHEIGHQMH